MDDTNNVEEREPFKCKNCGCTRFILEVDIRGTSTYSGRVYTDGDYEVEEFLSDYISDDGEAEDKIDCLECGASFQLSKLS